MNDGIKRTPLYDAHKKLGAKLVEFAGWEMPIQYAGIVQEHTTVRTAAGLFDVSHMGEVEVTGPEAEAALQYMTCNDVTQLIDGKAQYSAITNPQGGLVDDIIIYRHSRTHYLVCVNASNSDKDFAWFQKQNRFNAQFVNRSKEFGQIALQGPKAIKIFDRLAKTNFAEDTLSFHFETMQLVGAECIAARTGYTGEDGVEIFVPANKTADLWWALLEAGQADGIQPIGLGARDSLRLEACLSLYGHELSDTATAIESGVGWIVKPDKGDFIGRDILAKQKKDGAPRALVGLIMDGAGIARQHDKIRTKSGDVIGEVTSGTKTPCLDKAVALAIIDSKHRAVGTELNAIVRDREIACHIVKTPFYKRKGS
jgi:aminomethyltransferase